MLENLAQDKLPNLFKKIVNYGRKIFITSAPCVIVENYKVKKWPYSEITYKAERPCHAHPYL
jgi:hypothetical protein